MIEKEMSNEQFKLMLKRGNIEDLVQLVRSIYLEKEEKKAIGKKIYKADDDIMEEAERLLNEELATILNISPNEVSSYISSKISQ